MVPFERVEPLGQRAQERIRRAVARKPDLVPSDLRARRSAHHTARHGREHLRAEAHAEHRDPSAEGRPDQVLLRPQPGMSPLSTEACTPAQDYQRIDAVRGRGRLRPRHPLDQLVAVGSHWLRADAKPGVTVVDRDQDPHTFMVALVLH